MRSVLFFVMLTTACAGSDPTLALVEHLNSGDIASISAQPWALEMLSEERSDQAVDIVYDAYIEQLKVERAAELGADLLTFEEYELKLWHQTFGHAAEGERSLYISMHGGGSAPAEVNDQQWSNQQRLYQLDEGIYVAPRAPTDTWNMWHRPEMDHFIDRLIEDMVALRGVDPDRVYLTGYSAGGDGAYGLAWHMADRFAAANANAGHPNKSTPVSLRNLPFTVHVGGEDHAYDRAAVAAEWGEQLAELRAADPDGYVHDVQVHPGKPHWMDGAEKVALPWMAQFRRNKHPNKVVWRVRGARSGQRMVWLGLDDPEAHHGAVLNATIDGQQIRITTEAEAPVTGLRLWLDDELIDLDEDLLVEVDGQTVFEGRAERTIGTIADSLLSPGARFMPRTAVVDLP